MDVGDLLARPPESLDVGYDASGVALSVRPDVSPWLVWGSIACLTWAASDLGWPLLLLLVASVASWRRHEVRLTADGVRIVHHVGPWRWRVAVAWRDLGDVRCCDRLGAVVLERHDGGPIHLWAGGHPASDLRWLSALLERAGRPHGSRRLPEPEPDRGALDLLLGKLRTASP